MRELFFTVSSYEENQRLDVYLSDKIDTSRNTVQKYIENQNVSVNNQIKKSNYKISQNDEIKVSIPEPVSLDIVSENIPLNIIYEDDSLLIINKEKGMVVHPAIGHFNKTLVNALLYHLGDNLSSINGVLRPGIVHRIDKDTSGLLVVAKDDKTHVSLSAQLKEHSIKREYQGIVAGRVKNEAGKIDKPLGRHEKDRKKRAVTFKNSKDAITNYKVLEYLNAHSLMEFSLETGRTHQIRVHMASIGHPLLGDLLYGFKKQPFNTEGQVLHAKTLGFIHPKTNKYIEFNSELPEYFQNILGKLRIVN